MNVFSPEIAARALVPKDLLGQASSLHFALHVHKNFVAASLAEAAGGDFHWSGDFPIEDAGGSFENALHFIRERNWSEKVFRKFTLSFDTTEFTLVPTAFFQKEKEKQLLEFNTGTVGGLIESMEIPELDAVMIYSVDEHIRELTARFPNARIFPSAALFAKYAYAQSDRTEKEFHIYHTPGFMLLAVMQGKKLLLLNHYPVHTDEDILYYTSNAALRLDLDMENTRVRLYEMPLREYLENLFSHYSTNVKHVFKSDAGEKHQASFISHLHILCA